MLNVTHTESFVFPVDEYDIYDVTVHTSHNGISMVTVADRPFDNPYDEPRKPSVITTFSNFIIDTDNIETLVKAAAYFHEFVCDSIHERMRERAYAEADKRAQNWNIKYTSDC